MVVRTKLCGKARKHEAHYWTEHAQTIRGKPKATLKYCAGGAVPKQR